MRYVLKLGEDEFAKWIQWTATVSPLIRTGGFEEAMIIDENYLNTEVHPNLKKTRQEVLIEKYPEIKVIQVEITIKS